MATDSFELRISYRRLLIGLLVTVVPISLVGLYSIERSHDALQDTIGTHFKIVAESTAREVSQFTHERVTNVGTMATEPSVIDVITASNRSYEGVSDQAITARIQQIEEEWNTPAAKAVVTRVLSSTASARLRRYLDLDPRFLRITVTDERGATVSATHKTFDYFQADEEFWQAIYGEGRGAISLTGILYDDVTNSSYVGVGVPVLDQESNRFIGAIDALVDVSSLFGVVNQAHPPLNLRTTLVTADGTVISAPDVNLSMRMKSEEFVAIQDALTTIEGRQTGFLVTDVAGGDQRVIGFADTGLTEDYRNLGWVVLVSEEASSAFASIEFVGRLTAFLAFTGLAMVTFLAVYFSLHRRQQYTLREMEEAPPKAAGASG
ncbi:MAG: hypothetical protein GY953_46745 [bacterium]|nr:hypothetical protein [bacterium]